MTTDTETFHRAMNGIKPLRRIGIFILAFCIFLLSQLLLGMSLKTMLSMLPQIGALSPEIKEAIDKTRNEKINRVSRNSAYDIDENLAKLSSRLSKVKGVIPTYDRNGKNNDGEIRTISKVPRVCEECVEKKISSIEMDRSVEDIAVSANITTGVNLIGSE